MKKRICVIVCILAAGLILNGCDRTNRQVLWERETSTVVSEDHVDEIIEESDPVRTELCDDPKSDAVRAALCDDRISDEPVEQETVAWLYVDISGAVYSPGVYQLGDGARLFEAIECAGGLRPDADIASINQARVLKDQEKIHIFTIDERTAIGQTETMNDTESAMNAVNHDTQTDEGSASGDQRVNINMADEAQLMTLPGIGASRAQDIISYRIQNGPFSCTEDIMRVSGIKEAIFHKLKDHIVVE